MVFAGKDRNEKGEEGSTVANYLLAAHVHPVIMLTETICNRGVVGYCTVRVMYYAKVVVLVVVSKRFSTLYSIVTCDTRILTESAPSCERS